MIIEELYLKNRQTPGTRTLQKTTTNEAQSLLNTSALILIHRALPFDLVKIARGRRLKQRVNEERGTKDRPRSSEMPKDRKTKWKI